MMNADKAREVFDEMIAKNTDADRIAKLELLREYICNPEFRDAFHEFSFAATKED